MAEKILIVDDEPNIVKLAKVKLEREGFSVVAAHNGEEALRKVAGEKPDLIILDIMMPGMDGWEVAKRLRSDEKTRDIPIIMLTAKGVHEERVSSLVSVDEYYTKPFSPSRLAKLVKNLLAKRGPV